MERFLNLIQVGLFCLIGAGALSAAEAPNAAEVRMRETLRATMLQLRTAETERATLQAAQTDNEAKLVALASQVASLTKQSASDKDAADKLGTELRSKVSAQELEVARLNESLEKWKAGHKAASDLAVATEAKRAALAEQLLVANRKIVEQQGHNVALFKLGREILDRYERFGLGDALTAREPFVGITRVKFQNYIQDYQDQLVDNKIKPKK
jgi:hypothetical protein